MLRMQVDRLSHATACPMMQSETLAKLWPLKEDQQLEAYAAAAASLHCKTLSLKAYYIVEQPYVSCPRFV